MFQTWVFSLDSFASFSVHNKIWDGHLKYLLAKILEILFVQRMLSY